MMAGTAGATTFSNTTNLGYAVSGNGTTSWTHVMPADFQMPYDTVNSATLTIYSNYAENGSGNGDNDDVFAETTYVGTLADDGGLLWLLLDDQQFDIKSAITAPWPTGSLLDISLNYKEGGEGIIWLEKSVLCLNYNNVNAPVPEPGTMMLLGVGMFGVAIFGKRRMNKA